MGHSKTFEFLMSGKDITAKEAEDIGLINEIVSSENLRQEALNIAQKFAKKPIHFLSGIKKLLNWDFNEIETYLEYENNLLINYIR